MPHLCLTKKKLCLNNCQFCLTLRNFQVPAFTQNWSIKVLYTLLTDQHKTYFSKYSDTSELTGMLCFVSQTSEKHCEFFLWPVMTNFVSPIQYPWFTSFGYWFFKLNECLFFSLFLFQLLFTTQSTQYYVLIMYW